MKLFSPYGFCLLALGAFCLVECLPMPVPMPMPVPVPMSMPVLSQSDPRRQLDVGSVDINRVLKMFQKNLHPKFESRSITAFVTDPALLVTILHSLEIAYWTMPFGFILTPIINLFRMPNRRMDENLSLPNESGGNARSKQFYRTLIKAITKIEKMNGKAREAKSSAPTQTNQKRPAL